MDDEDEKHRFMNYYRCPDCHAEWQNTWSCMCNDGCPRCGTKDIEPYQSEDL